MSGIYLQWIHDNAGRLNLSLYEKEILFITCRNTYGYRLGYGYILQELFLLNMSIMTLKRHRKKLIEKGLIKFKPTNRMSYYELILPEEVTNEFDFQYVKNPIAYAIAYIKQYIEKNKIKTDELKSLRTNAVFKGLFKLNEAIDAIVAEAEADTIKFKNDFNSIF